VAALLFQAILFQHGGLSTLGVNALVMGIPALCSAFLFRFHNRGGKKMTALRAFMAGFCGVMISAIGVALF
jgi:cobalt/nickel transport system permease protein